MAICGATKSKGRRLGCAKGILCIVAAAGSWVVWGPTWIASKFLRPVAVEAFGTFSGAWAYQHRCTHCEGRVSQTDVNLEDDPWEVLGLTPGATKEEVKAQYRRLVHKYHPDLGGPQSSSFFMGRIIRAFKSVIKIAPQPKKPAEKAPAPPQHEKRETDPNYIYSGRSRCHNAVWAEYRIMKTHVEVSWALSHAAIRVGAKKKELFKFEEVSQAVIAAEDVALQQCDIRLEFKFGTDFLLEQIPFDVAARVQKIVKVARLKWEMRRQAIMR